MKIRLPKKFVLIVGGVLVLCGGSGAAAVYVGTDKLLGPSYLETNGLDCTALQTVKIKRGQRNWVRKYVVSDEPGDGMARIKTALRVARTVQEREKADLVQVALLDKAGPTDRADMRGRMIGAQVLYIPDLSKAPEGAVVQTYSAYYVDGPATAKGEFYGLRIDLPLEDVEALTAKLTDKTDCVEPEGLVPEGEHGASSGHGDKKKPKPKGGDHGAPSGHGEPAGHGEAPAADAHGAPADPHAAPADAHGESAEVAAKDSGGFLSSITRMVFGSKEEAPAESHDAPADAHAKPADGHAVPAADAAPAESHKADADDHPAPAASADHAAPPVVATDAPAKQEASFLDSMKSMIFGAGEKTEALQDTSSASPVPAAEPAPEPRTSAEGGKRWSASTDADVIRSDAAAEPAAHAEAKLGDGSTDADEAGAAWLAKFREQQAAKP